MWTNKIFLITTWWILDFLRYLSCFEPLGYSRDSEFGSHALKPSWREGRFVRRTRTSSGYNSPFLFTKNHRKLRKKDLILSSYQPWKIPMWEWITKITPICVHGQHLFGWSVWTYFDMVSHWQLKKLFHHVMSCFDDMYLYLLLPTEITEIMDRPQPRKSNVFIRPGPKNNTSLHPPSATTGLSYQPKRQFHRLGAKGKNMKNEDLIKIWIFVQSIQASFNGPRGKLIRGKLAHLFQHRTVWRGQPPACQCWGGTPSSPGIVGDVPFKLDYINSMIS